MNSALKRLLIEPFTVIRRNTSFILIVLVVLFVDQLKNKIMPDFSLGEKIDSYVEWIYVKLPQILLSSDMLWTIVIIGIITLPIICLGQLWVSSNLRIFYLNTKSNVTMLKSLSKITIWQFLWTMVNFIICSSFFLIYEIIVFMICQSFWHYYKLNTIYFLFILVMALFPFYFAYISLANKVVLIDSRKSFSSWLIAWKDMSEILKFDKMWKVYIFYFFRVLINSILKGAVPAASLFFIDSFSLRIAIASISFLAAHVYVKSSSFELFLYIFKDNIRVRQHFNSFYSYAYRS